MVFQVCSAHVRRRADDSQTWQTKVVQVLLKGGADKGVWDV